MTTYAPPGERKFPFFPRKPSVPYKTPQKTLDPNITIHENKSLELFNRVLTGNYEEIMKYIMEGTVTFNLKNDNDETVLHAIILNGTAGMDEQQKYDLINYLINSHSVPVSAKSKDNVTALQLAANQQLKTVVQLLLYYGADVQDTDSLGQNALHYAVRGNLEECKEQKLVRKDYFAGKTVKDATILVKSLAYNTGTRIPRDKMKPNIENQTREVAKVIWDVLHKSMVFNQYFKHIEATLSDFYHLYLEEGRKYEKDFRKKITEIMVPQITGFTGQADRTLQQKQKIREEIVATGNSVADFLKEQLKPATKNIVSDEILDDGWAPDRANEYKILPGPDTTQFINRLREEYRISWNSLFKSIIDNYNSSRGNYSLLLEKISKIDENTVKIMYHNTNMKMNNYWGGGLPNDKIYIANLEINILETRGLMSSEIDIPNKDVYIQIQPYRNRHDELFAIDPNNVIVREIRGTKKDRDNWDRTKIKPRPERYLLTDDQGLDLTGANDIEISKKYYHQRQNSKRFNEQTDPKYHVEDLRVNNNKIDPLRNQAAINAQQARHLALVQHNHARIDYRNVSIYEIPIQTQFQNNILQLQQWIRNLQQFPGNHILPGGLTQQQHMTQAQQELTQNQQNLRQSQQKLGQSQQDLDRAQQKLNQAQQQFQALQPHLIGFDPVIKVDDIRDRNNMRYYYYSHTKFHIGRVRMHLDRIIQGILTINNHIMNNNRYHFEIYHRQLTNIIIMILNVIQNLANISLDYDYIKGKSGTLENEFKTRFFEGAKNNPYRYSLEYAANYANEITVASTSIKEATDKLYSNIKDMWDKLNEIINFVNVASGQTFIMSYFGNNFADTVQLPLKDLFDRSFVRLENLPDTLDRYISALEQNRVLKKDVNICTKNMYLKLAQITIITTIAKM